MKETDDCYCYLNECDCVNEHRSNWAVMGLPTDPDNSLNKSKITHLWPALSIRVDQQVVHMYRTTGCIVFSKVQSIVIFVHLTSMSNFFCSYHFNDHQ